MSDELALRAREARRRWRREAPASDAPGERFTLGVAATFTTAPLAPYLGCELLDLGLSPAFLDAPFDQVFQACLDPRAAFGTLPSCVLLLWRLEDLAEQALVEACRGNSGAGPLLEVVDRLADAVAALRGEFDGAVLAALPPRPRPASCEPTGLLDGPALGSLHRAAVERFTARLAEVGGVELLDLDDVLREHGAAAAHDPRTWYLARQPYRELLWCRLSHRAARLLAARLRPPRKVLALDCDGTLWGGVVGEDGLEGLQLGDDFPGSAFRDLQRRVQGLAARGVLLALLSKNDEAAVLEVLDHHDGMVLGREDLVGWRIDWGPKPANLRALADELGLAVDSFVFLDDSAFEVAQMREALPEVLSIQVPEDPARLLEVLDAHHPFDRLATTEEDRRRTRLYREEGQRRQASRGLTHEGFLASLELEVECFPVEPPHLERVSQLVGRTNQFNLTTRRRTRDELESLIAGAQHRLTAVRVRDRFGDYGLTGVVIVERRGAAFDLDTFLLSCRVLGRGVEDRVLAHVLAAARTDGAAALTGRFLPTARNAPAATFLPDHGFVEQEDGSWRLDLGDADEVLPSTP